MKIEIYRSIPATRVALFRLALQEGSVFADFDSDARGLLFLRRISFDGYGCCEPKPLVDAMSQGDSHSLLAMVATGMIDVEPAATVLRAYFKKNEAALWADALQHHQLV